MKRFSLFLIILLTCTLCFPQSVIRRNTNTESKVNSSSSKHNTSKKQNSSAYQSITNNKQNRRIDASYSDGILSVNGVTYKMVFVSAGSFIMGATSEMKDPNDNEKPLHRVTLSSYSIGQTEVTQALWKAVMGKSVTEIANENGWELYGVGDNYPMYAVSWNDCKTFISKLNSLTGKNFRLPTEAEWEFAARGGNNSSHYQYSGSNKLDDVAWYWKNSGDKYLEGTDNDRDENKIEKNNCKTHPAAQKQANELGIYDMSGNIFEWCSDWYGNYSSNSQTNPTGPNSGTYRVCRGGSWIIDAGGCRSSYRGGGGPDDRGKGLGLRLCLSE